MGGIDVQIVGLVAAYFVYQIARYALARKNGTGNGSTLTQDEKFYLRTCHENQQKSLGHMQKMADSQRDMVHILDKLADRVGG